MEELDRNFTFLSLLMTTFVLIIVWLHLIKDKGRMTHYILLPLIQVKK
jgi:hypothetical protein